ncbi:MAG: rhodanese-like domain-containing protein [Hyphomicrobiales bacterium]
MSNYTVYGETKANEATVMYKGDVRPAEAYEKLEADKDAVLIDVRTVPEWNFVGVPVVSRLLRLEWQMYPSMQVNPEFVEVVENACIAKDADVFVLCRSGVRSIVAAEALTEAGFENAYNVLEGFEGDKDQSGHRATVGGWKVAGLPWQQG